MSKIWILPLVLSSSLLSAAQTSSFHSPLTFEPNLGQAPSNVRWLAHGPGYQMFFTTQGVSLVVTQHSSLPQLRPASLNPPSATAEVIAMQLDGDGLWSTIEGVTSTGGFSNYFLGDDPSQWRTHVPQYSRIRIRDVYQGIDLIFYSLDNQLEYDFVVSPGVDPRQIRLRFLSSGGLPVKSESNALLIGSPSRPVIRQRRPLVYQQLAGRFIEVDCTYRVSATGVVGFDIPAYDARQTLVIDPVVSFTKFLAGNDSDVGVAIAADSGGNSYVTGETFSTNYPKVGGIQTDQPSVDAFVTKLSPKGDIIFSTYIGGKTADFGAAISVAPDGGIFVVGSTNSADFPSRDHRTGAGPKGYDAFLIRLNPLGNSFSYSVFIGGTSTEFGFGLTTDAAGSVYVTGVTFSTDFPVYNASQPSFGGKRDAFLVKYTLRSGVALQPAYATYIGGSAEDEAYGVAADSKGNAYVTGYTSSYDFKTVGASQGYPAGASSTAFVSMFEPNGAARFSVYFGGGSDVGYAIAALDVGSVFIAGATSSFNLPVSSGAFQHNKPSPGNLASGFAAKIVDPGLFVFSTYLSGSNGDTFAKAISLHPSGAIYVAGNTSSTTFPGAPRLTPDPSAGFVVKFQPYLNALDYTVFLGAAINGIAVLNGTPGLFTTGWRYTGGHNPSNADAFVVRLDEN